MSVLFEPFKIRNLTLPNRVVMAPMTRNFSPNGVPGQNVADYYAKRAESDVGLIVSEGTTVNRPEASNDAGIPHFHGEASLAGWKNVVDAVHAKGGLFAPQIWHTGGVREQIPKAYSRPGEAEGPSGLYMPDQPYGKAMTEEDVADTVEAFAQACEDAVAIGCDAIELHGAHGYLIDQFFWDGTNQRTDQYGGATLPERTRFATDILKAVRARIGETPLILRISQWNQQDYSRRMALTPDELAAWTQPLVDAGADILHCSQRRFWEPEFPELDGENGLNFAGWVKKLTGVPTMSVGSVSLDRDFFLSLGGHDTAVADLGQLEERMDKGEFDLIAVGRALISNPDWVEKVKQDKIAELDNFTSKDLAELV
ncbi:NADH:flavin oxidoreductase [uncultured Erythrobacter sp.]|uniref:NADH:flavin oxidoreductase n=1 Tax=uncultured Erythrobacter sp. TaxID=263913 RepID=UPI00260D6F64|nr:NADH:flavin oxidoreductase [uncultured Erythrobacter sp.]